MLNALIAAQPMMTKPMMRGLRYLALTCALSLPVTPAFAGKAAADKTRHEPSKAATDRDKAQLAFQRDLVSVLAPRADALPLLGAALLARPLFNQPPSNSFHALIGRAAQADGADAAVSWARLADCDAKADACPNTAALDQLLVQAPDNAAVWLLKLGADAHDMKHDAAREDLGKAANSKLYDDYTGASLKALASSIGVLPPPAGTFDPASKSGAVGMQAMLVYGIAGTQPQPGLQLIAKLCENAGSDASTKADCLKLGKLLEWGSSPLSRSLGLHLREVLADDPTQQQEAKDARRNLIWQVQSFGQLLTRVRDEPAMAQHLLALARNGGTEMSLLLAALRDNSIPAEAPADWQPREPG
ncbi:hypothetical protein SAMN05428972_1886 [Rhodanobacter sp. OK091]|nr:hypothetical protein SAMN05428972_1886 [Rhodanobacter sp. OK091]